MKMTQNTGTDAVAEKGEIADSTELLESYTNSLGAVVHRLERVLGRLQGEAPSVSTGAATEKAASGDLSRLRIAVEAVGHLAEELQEQVSRVEKL